ncbi:MAG: RIP metalloprotease RseP [Acidobacteriota bacterium]
MALNFSTNFIAFIIVLGFLIFAHEAGHFFVAKLFRVRVLVFSFGFGKRLFGFHRGPTDYRVSLIPLGGYVRMAGDTPEENQPANPDEFLSKPKWQRFLILLAGPLMNIIIALVFVAGLLMMGTETLAVGTVVSSVTPGKPGAVAGLQRGDRIVAVGGERVDNFDDLRMAISLQAGTPLRVEYVRNGVRRTTTLTPERENTDLGPIGRAWIVPYQPTIVGRVLPDSPAARAGLRAGDRIVAANGRPTPEYPAFTEVFNAAKDGAIALDVQRGASTLHLTLPAAPVDLHQGFRGVIPPTVVRKYSVGTALAESVRQNWKMLRFAFITLGRLVRGEASVKELSGPLSIARISGEMLRRGWVDVVALMAMISLQLGVMNLLPIPVLDGGHIMILLIEGLFRRELSLRVKERIQQVGFAVLAALMIVVLYNDVITNVLLMRKG